MRRGHFATIFQTDVQVITCNSGRKCAIIGLPVWSAVCPAQLLATQTSQTRREIRSAAVTGSGDFRTETLARLWNFPFPLSSNQIPRC